MNPETSVLLILFLVCTLYCIVLEFLHDSYVPDWIWLTVVVGEGFVIGALALQEHYGVDITALRVFYANAVSGTPIIIWQLYQAHKRMQERHSGATPRSEAVTRAD